jgi:hypothetical protein
MLPHDIHSFMMFAVLQVDVSAMVPTVVLGLLQHVAAHNINHLHGLKRIVIGGAAPPRSMIETVEK